jgi:hypothetical protein
VAEFELPAHVITTRRDGRREIVLHRSIALISDDKVEVKGARSTVILPLIGIALVLAIGTWIARTGGALPFWLLVVFLYFCLIMTPLSFMSLVGVIAGADVVVDGTKGAATWQQGYLGMGIGTKELVPFAKIDHLEITIEGDQPDRWRDETDALRQFALVLVKQSGKRLTVANVPVSASDQADGMDRTLALGNAIAAITGARIELPAGWELVEINVETGDVVPPKPSPARGARKSRKRR